VLKKFATNAESSGEIRWFGLSVKILDTNSVKDRKRLGYEKDIR